MAEKRISPIAMNSDEFRKTGYELIDRIADFLDAITDRPVTTGLSGTSIRELMGTGTFPATGCDTGELFRRTADLCFNHSLFNGHPNFLGYITSSAAPAGALADLLAAAVNPNVGARILSPVATEIERQTVQWLAEFIGVDDGYGGLLVSGGNMANFTGFLAARTSRGPAEIKANGISGPAMTLYCAKTTHTWIEKAAMLFGLGTNAIRWIPVTDNNMMDTDALDAAIRKDLAAGNHPFLVVGTAGDVSTGAVDDLRQIANICAEYSLWFHVDGAYGVPAVAVPSVAGLFDGLKEADSIALDPHKWLYAPLEAGCTLVKNPQDLQNTFSSHPEYYNFSKGEEPSLNYYEYGLQNSRGFRALKVWITLQQAGRSGYEQMISDDIRLARLLYQLADAHEELEAVTQNLSITTFRYIPADQAGTDEDTLNQINSRLLDEIQQEGEIFLSNAIVNNRYCLRGCIVNFRTDETAIHQIISTVVRKGRECIRK